jgi:hypothetical protein
VRDVSAMMPMNAKLKYRGNNYQIIRVDGVQK